TRNMSIDFTLPPDVEQIRQRVRDFMDAEVRPAEEKLAADAPDGVPDRKDVVRMIIELRQKAHEWDVWLPHMPKEWGGLGLSVTRVGLLAGGGGAHQLRPLHPQRAGARRGQPAHAPAPRHRRAEGEVPPTPPRG